MGIFDSARPHSDRLALLSISESRQRQEHLDGSQVKYLPARACYATGAGSVKVDSPAYLELRRVGGRVAATEIPLPSQERTQPPRATHHHADAPAQLTRSRPHASVSAVPSGHRAHGRRRAGPAGQLDLQHRSRDSQSATFDPRRVRPPIHGGRIEHATLQVALQDAY